MILHAFFLVMLCVVFVQGGAYGAGVNTDKKVILDKEISKLQAADAAWRRNDAEFRELRKQGQISQVEIREFAAFLAGLKRQVIEGCEAVRRLGVDASQHCVDCIKILDEPESKKGGAGSIDTDASYSYIAIVPKQPTSKDEIALLESKLEELESEFDGMILKEQNALGGKGESSQSSGSWASGAVDKSGANETASISVSHEGSGAGSRSKAEPNQREYEPGGGPGVDKGNVPEFETGDVGDGTDDDVVARQLREAAEAETDPLLKEQLWKEYKKYKSTLN